MPYRECRFPLGNDGSGRALSRVDDIETGSLTQVFYREYEGNSQRAGQYGLAGGKCEGTKQSESDLKGRRGSYWQMPMWMIDGDG
jgi:hypothetical protein